jgi:hypothetical protein
MSGIERRAFMQTTAGLAAGTVAGRGLAAEEPSDGPEDGSGDWSDVRRIIDEQIATDFIEHTYVKTPTRLFQL